MGNVMSIDADPPLPRRLGCCGGRPNSGREGGQNLAGDPPPLPHGWTTLECSPN